MNVFSYAPTERAFDCFTVKDPTVGINARGKGKNELLAFYAINQKSNPFRSSKTVTGRWFRYLPVVGELSGAYWTVGHVCYGLADAQGEGLDLEPKSCGHPPYDIYLNFIRHAESLQHVRVVSTLTRQLLEAYAAKPRVQPRTGRDARQLARGLGATARGELGPPAVAELRAILGHFNGRCR